MSARGRHKIVKWRSDRLRLPATVFALVRLALLPAHAQSEPGAVPSFPVTGMDSTFARLAGEALTALEAERYGEVVQKATAALARKPDNKTAAAVYRWRGVAYDNLGDTDRALADYTSAIRAYPAVKWVHGYRGVLYRRRGEYGKAVADLTVALRDADSRAYVYSARARAYARLGDKAAARRDYEQAIATAGNDSAALSARADAYAALGRYKEAAAHHAAAKRVAPLDPSVLNAAAWFEATCPEAAYRDGKAAVREALRACERSKWKNADIIDTLAAAYAERDDFGRAVAFQQRAIAIARALPNEKKHMQDRLRLFQERKPYRQEPEV